MGVRNEIDALFGLLTGEGLSAIKMASAARESGSKLISASRRPDGLWNVNVKSPGIRGKRLHTVRLRGLEDEQTAAFLGVFGMPQNRRNVRKK